MVSAKDKAQQIIKDNGVVVFSKSYCPYCKASKALLKEQNAKFYLMELDEVGTLQLSPCHDSYHKSEWIANLNARTEDGAALQDALEGITGQRSVPNIFISQKHIGGNSDLQAKSKDLPELLKSAGAI